MGAYPSSIQLANSGQRLPVRDLGSAFQRGIATLIAGSATVANVVVTADSKIFLSVNTPGGTPGFLDARTANRTVGPVATGDFDITSSQAADTATVEWMIVG